MREKKVLLVNSYSVNNGDFALILALYEQLKARGFKISVATHYYDFLKEKYPDFPFIRELLDQSALPNATFIKRIFHKVAFLFNKPYHNHSIFIASPGGYVNSYYGIKKSLLSLIEAKRRGSKTAIYSQSIGPLNARDQKLLTEYSKSIDVILVRDAYSQRCISSIPCFSKVFQTKDAAFLLPPRISKAKPNTKTVAVSVREWTHDNRSMGDFYNMLKSFCISLLNNGFKIEFISTCQGVKDYRDDSIVASAICKSILTEEPHFVSELSVTTAYYTYFQLVDRLNTMYCFTVGTRLHMCILSLLNGIPAFNISYEVKGTECYRYLGLEEYSVDFNEPESSAKIKFNRFVENHALIQEALPDKLLPIHEESKHALEMFIAEMDI